MKNKNYIILIIAIILFIIAIGFWIYAMNVKKDDVKSNSNDLVKEVAQNQIGDEELNEHNSNVSTLKSVILQVHSNSLMVMPIPDTGLYSVSLRDIGNDGLKKGQEILIYFDGIVLDSYPAQIPHVDKIEITNEKTNITIPDKYLEYYNTPTNNMRTSFLELTRTGISFLIKSENEILLDDSESYEIFKRVIYKDGIVSVERLDKISNISIEDTITITPDLENESDEYFVYRYDIEWKEIYGELEALEERKLYASIFSR